LNVTSNPDFILSEPSAFPLVKAGTSSTSGPISIASQDTFAGTVNLTCTPATGSTCSVSPTSVNSFPASATVTVNASGLVAGSYQFSVQGTSGATTHTQTVPFNVGDYQLSGPSSLSVAPSAQAVANLTITPSTFYSGQINATCDASAISATICTLSPANPITVNPGSAVPLTATINIPSTAASGTFNINISSQDTSGTPTHNFTVALTVGQDFSLHSSTASQTVSAGQTTGPYNLTVAPVGTTFNGAVTLTCSQLPSLAQCQFNPSAPFTPGSTSTSVVMTISSVATTARLQEPGNYRLILFAMWLGLPGIVIAMRSGRRPQLWKRWRLGPMLGLVLLALTLSSCGGTSSAGGGRGGHLGTPPGPYTISVTASSGTGSGTISHSTTVGLIVQ
jgi:hypothetical protein